ncbi:fumarylacetoacetate hydrolase family protein [Actinomadura barringtoniae]|uniref:Fumarylacetoacetate hydrolase family protein n=1 Tax=Actinomadura barringtoniae TaxID=1427535 RepID=A0A939PA06_9ACTN|nr:fumarylacetoacetate hydrolase family protein [Actinomadura barringtoniae]MBO2448588.1 fumarylacetoacetate hydrolase family protein [Actinomadura barringtoniae]
MRIANLKGRLVLVEDDTAVDVAEASGGRFPADPQAVFAEWDAFRDWAASQDAASPTPAGTPFAVEDLGPPVPRPSQVFAIGINYAEHAREAGYPPDSAPVTFTKFPSCLAGPDCEVELPSGTVDWEVEAVVAISREAWRVRREDAWDRVAGLTVGQDLSERTSQLAGAKPQFSLAKSFTNFGPTGPWLVTPDIRPGEVLVSELEGVGRITQRFVPAADA